MYTLALAWCLIVTVQTERAKRCDVQWHRTEITASLNHTLTDSEWRRSGPPWGGGGGLWGEGIWDGKTLAKFYINYRFCLSTMGPVYHNFSLYINLSSLYRVYFSKCMSLSKRGILFLIEAVLFNLGSCQMDVCISVIWNVHLTVRGQFCKTDVRFSDKNYI